MTLLDLAFRDFVDALETAHDEVGFKGAADRLAARLRFRLFAYLGFSEPALKVLSSHPSSWARQDIERRYEDIDPERWRFDRRVTSAITKSDRERAHR